MLSYDIIKMEIEVTWWRKRCRQIFEFSKIEMAITHRQMSHMDPIFEVYTSFLIVYHVSFKKFKISKILGF